jgi:hypothetical protein
MSEPRLRRDGDSFVLTWDTENIGIGLEHLQESRDGLHAEVTIESTDPERSGHVHGPVRLNILSTESQNRLAKVLNDRVNHTDWQGLITMACYTVAQKYRQPPPLVDLAECEDPGPVDKLIPGIPTGETTGFYGDGEGGKSMFTLQIAVAARTGLMLPWGVSIKKPLTVMILDFETNQQTMLSRLNRIVRGFGLAKTPSIYYREMHRPLVDVVDALRVERSRLAIDLFLIDSLSFACPGSLNDDDVARDAMNAQRQLAPATRLFVAHISQEAAKATYGPVRPFGSAFFWNGMRSGWEIRRAEESPPHTVDIGVYHRKSNDGEHEKPFGISIGFDGNAGPIRFTRGDLADNPDLIGRTPIKTRIRAALRAGALDTRELATATGESEGTVRKTLGRMADVVEVSGGGGRGNVGRWGLAK